MSMLSNSTEIAVAELKTSSKFFQFNNQTFQCISAVKRRIWEGNVFSRVCMSTCSPSDMLKLVVQRWGPSPVTARPNALSPALVHSHQSPLSAGEEMTTANPHCNYSHKLDMLRAPLAQHKEKKTIIINLICFVPFNFFNFNFSIFKF